MKIEVGKKYRTREGGTAEVRANDGFGVWPFKGINNTKSGWTDSHASWTPEGRYNTVPADEHEHDLVAEIEETVEAGGCAPPVVVDGPVATVYDAMGERVPEPVEIKPVVHDEPPALVDYEPMAVEAMAALRFLLREVDSRCGGRIEGHSPLADAATLARAVVDRYGT